MSRGKQLTKEEKATIIYLGRECGLKLDQIARITGRSKSSASRVLQEEDDSMRAQSHTTEEQSRESYNIAELLKKVYAISEYARLNNEILTRLLRELCGDE